MSFFFRLQHGQEKEPPGKGEMGYGLAETLWHTYIFTVEMTYVWFIYGDCCFLLIRPSVGAVHGYLDLLLSLRA